MGKPDSQAGRNSARFSSPPFPGQAGGSGVALEEDDASNGGSFYRPASRKAASDRPSLTGVPFRDKKNNQADDEEDEPFLRSNRRVAVRRGLFPRSRWGRIAIAAGAIVAFGGLAWLGFAVRSFAAHDPRFRIDSSDNIQILGNSEVTQTELLSVFGGDMGRNVFFIPLSERRTDLERLPWVETATVMRLLPDQLRVSVTERTPVAFARDGNQIGLVDHDGVLLPMDPKTMAARHYSFPVVTGIVAGEPQSTRAARMKIYQRFLAELDSGGEKVSAQLSEIDLSDPEDVKVLAPSDGADLLLHLGDHDFLSRWHNYQQHLAEWKTQYPRLASVDLRYERQVVLEMEKGAPIAPSQDAAGKTIDDLKAEVGGDPPPKAKQVATAKAKASGKAKPHSPVRAIPAQSGGH